uniref:Transcription initiation factor TFIID subunit 8 n=1 Tax=Araucaria cunninghamii TaxID=56994 RepID=A0A0D6QY83_ARACU
MSNGGTVPAPAFAPPESSRNDSDRRGAEGDEFGRAVARVAVAQICEGAGFQGCQQSVLDALADIAVRYLRDLGKSAHYYANLAGRTDCNALDVIQALEDMNNAQGFAGAADVTHRRLSASQTVRDVVHYTNRAEEIPFARPVPCFPVLKKRRREAIPSFIHMGEAPAHAHIPPWLPALPDPHTYVHTPVWNERKTDPRNDKIEQARQRRKAERSLLNLQQRLFSAGRTQNPNGNPSSSPNPNLGLNPFLAPPVPGDERPVSPVQPPARVSAMVVDQNGNAGSRDGAEGRRRITSVMEAFAPVIEMAKEGLDRGEEVVFNRESNGFQNLPDERPLVQFKFDFGKKAALAAHMTGAGLKDGGTQPLSAWFGRDEEKDEKKRRAEQILKAAMENPQDLAQL